MKRAKEAAIKRKRLKEFLKREKLAGVVLSRRDNFSWYTAGGDNKVVMCSDLGASSVIATGRGKDVILTTNIEAPRIENEELKGLTSFRVKAVPWHNEEKVAEEVAKVARRIGRRSRIASDSGIPGTVPLPPGFTELTYSLTDSEIARFRKLGASAARAMEIACRAVKPGMTELQVAGLLCRSLLAEGALPHVVLIAADRRIMLYRHPVPTTKKLKRHLMVVACAYRWGLIASLTRFVHFGKVPPAILKKHRATCTVDTALISNTIVGRKVGEVFDAGRRAYAKVGFANEWKLHHQGGPAGYQGRSYKGRHGESRLVLPKQAFAWNPSITGTKSEDTIVASPKGGRVPEILTRCTPRWPHSTYQYKGVEVERPDILVR